MIWVSCYSMECEYLVISSLYISKSKMEKIWGQSNELEGWSGDCVKRNIEIYSNRIEDL